MFYIFIVLLWKERSFTEVTPCKRHIITHVLSSRLMLVVEALASVGFGGGGRRDRDGGSSRQRQAYGWLEGEICLFANVVKDTVAGRLHLRKFRTYGRYQWHTYNQAPHRFNKSF